jgi:FkbM family methyltransferase
MIYVDELDSLKLRKNGVYGRDETEFIQSFIKPDMVCVDIGANIGYFTILMAKLARETIAFEPDPQNYDLLIQNIRLNGPGAVVAYNYAVGKTSGVTKLYKCGTNSGMHRVYPSKWCNSGTENIDMVTLDSMIEYADFIKMDIEGAEYGALLGMKRILEKGCTLLMEFHTPSIREYGKEPIEVYNYMLDLGYNITYGDDRPLRGWNDLNHRATKHAGINILCTPKR